MITIVHFGDAAATFRCLESLGSAIGCGARVLVVDAGPGALPAAALERRFGAQLEVRPVENLGYASGCRRGIDYARAVEAPFVLLMNNDSVATPGAVEALLAAAGRNVRAGLLAPMVVCADRSDRVWSLGSMADGKPIADCPSIEFEATWAVGAVLLLPIWVVDLVGPPSDDFFLYHEEDEFVLRVKAAGLPIVAVPTAVFAHGRFDEPYFPHPRKAFYEARNRLLLYAKIRRYASPPMRRWVAWTFIIRGYPLLFLRCAETRQLRILWAAVRGLAWGLAMERGRHRPRSERRAGASARPAIGAAELCQ